MKPRTLLATNEESQSNMLEKSSNEVTVPVRKATGPRTPAGKQRSKYNATQHGIFSSVVVLKGESRADYEILLEGLRDSLQPVGEAEEILVEKLAMILWRHHRLVIAEGAEIRKGHEFLEWDQQQQRLSEAEGQARKGTEIEPADSVSRELGLSEIEKEGLIWASGNRVILDRCLELLVEVREDFEAEGFSSDKAESILETIYGKSGKNHLHRTLVDSYNDWAETAEAPEEERKREGYATPDECKDNVLEAIDDEIARLKRSRKELLEVEARRTEVEKLRQSIPDSASIDRLMRYETTLERSFDRTLSQLERLQRMRLGHPVPPPLKVQVSEN